MAATTDFCKQKTSFLDSKNLTAHQAKEKAQYIAFAPVIFKVALALRNLGILQLIETAGNKGLSIEALQHQIPYSEYGLNVLLHGGVQAGLLSKNHNNFILTSTGYFFLNDEMTKVNFDFVNDVCYRPLEHLESSIKNKRPEGLKEFGNWQTVYEGLSQLPPQVQNSWFAFDHFYSDDVFDKVMPILFKNDITTILDIGGNTGKFAKRCIAYNPKAIVTIVDLPGQIGIAKNAVLPFNTNGNIQFHEADMLLHENQLPSNTDIIWMSQFLDCFSENEVISILKKCVAAMQEHTMVYILEPLTNRQRYPAAAFVVQLTSLYFTTVANGNSRMYSFEDMESMIKKAGLEITSTTENLGICQTLIACKKATT